LCGDQRDVMLPVFSQCNSHTDCEILYTLYNKGMAQLSWYENSHNANYSCNVECSV